MKLRLVLAACLALALILGACFDSLVNDQCSPGYAVASGSCVPIDAFDAGGVAGADAAIADAAIADAAAADAAAADARRVDAGTSSPDARVSDASVVDARVTDAAVVDTAAPIDAVAIDAVVADALVADAGVCTAPEIACHEVCVDGQSDPDNCGGCDRACASGVCSNGSCTGTLRGHIVAIGHDYRSRHAAMARVLGNAVALGAHDDVAIGRLHGTADSTATAGTTAAIASALTTIGRPSHSTNLPATPVASTLTGIDVVVLDAQDGDGAATEANGVAWRSALNTFLSRGGVVILLEGTAGVSYRFAAGATLYAVSAPLDVTEQLAYVVDGADVTTQQVVSPYRAESTSVSLPGSQHAVITSADGGTVAFHLIR